jgi:hypothetical protein
MIRVASIEDKPASCILSVFLEISWLTFVQNGQSASVFSVKFKLEAVRYAQEHGNSAAGRKSDVDETNVRRQSGEKGKLEGISKRNVHFVVKSASIHMRKPNYINMLRIRGKTDLQYRQRCCNSNAAG